MQAPVPFRFKGQQLWLSPDRCIFWEEERSLIVSDLHFGKTGHFRKWGIAVPQAVYREDLQRLLVQIQYFRPRQLLIVGDLFHSRENKELELFLKWREDFANLTYALSKAITISCMKIGTRPRAS
jgi:metallophosphoesterase superfamily enzyme